MGSACCSVPKTPGSSNSGCSGHKRACRGWRGTSSCGRATATAHLSSMRQTAGAAGGPYPRATCRAPMKLKSKSMPAFLKRDSLIRREFLSSSQIPYTAHVSEQVIRTKWGDYVQVFRLSGASFESADDEQLNNWHERLAIALRNVASPNVALWTHVIRRRERSYPQGAFEPGFAADLNAHYKERLSGERLMVNELYLSVVYRSTTGVVTNWTSKVLSRTTRDAVELDLEAALEACEKLRQTLLASLDRYEIE